jgi:excinuclease ABC subunit C
MRDQAGRVVYVGRSRDLATRVRSYWVDLRDRPHLARMVGRVEWVEPVVCESEHEAAFLESDLLERHPTRYNRTLGMESVVWLRLDSRPASPSLDVFHDVDPHDGAEWFGPYLGWEPARQARAGLLRLYPIAYTGAAITRSDRELARSLRVGEADRDVLARRIRAVLRREPGAVRDAMHGLEASRERAAERLMFEHAADVQESIRGLRWVTEVQKLNALEPVDGDHRATAFAAGEPVSVVLSLRGGRMAQRQVLRGRRVARSGDSPWSDLARENAELMAALIAHDAVAPNTAWRR